MSDTRLLYECVGFLQNDEQSQVHGTDIAFAADVLCGWSDADRLTAMAPSERSKLYVTGPTLAMSRRAVEERSVLCIGLVCENLHSVRFTQALERRSLFVDQFEAFAGALDARGEALALRPHPGGQYVVRNGIELPANVTLENRPVYRVDLSHFAYGISAPSTILIDMILAGIPVALWNDPEAGIDARNYDGLHSIVTLDDWLAFERDAVRDPAPFLARQADFLNRTGMIVDPAEVQARFARLLAGAGTPIALRDDRPARRILFFANAVIPSFTISFLRPLEQLRQDGRIEYATITELDLTEGFASASGPDATEWVEEQIADYRPDLIVACRYSGPQSQTIVDCARRLGIPIVYHLDDDLLNIPPEIGAKKHKAHNAPKRLASVTRLLEAATLIYTSTAPLRDRIASLGFTTLIAAGEVYCSAEIRRAPTRLSHGKIGYMGFDHAHDLDTILPAIVAVMERNPGLRFELFGSIPMPAALKRFGDRVTSVPPIRDYEAFMRHYAAMDWDIGICPLADTPFNRLKADTKWVRV